MKNIFIKQLAGMLTMLFLVSIVVFTMVHLQPGNPYAQMINPNTSPEMIQEKLEAIGFYDPMPLRYFKWASRALVGDMGYSIKYGKPVTKVIGERMGNTLWLTGVSMLASFCISIPLGVFSATQRNTIRERILKICTFLGLALPSFLLSYFLIKVFVVDLKWLPASGRMSLGVEISGLAAGLDFLKHLILPAAVLTFLNVVILIRYTASAMDQVLGEVYIQTAKSKGLSRKTVIWKHGFRNALITLITLFCLQIPTLFSGALITETIFVWPGIGRLGYEAILSRDYPLIMGLLMMNALIVILSNFLAELLYAVADPRIRHMEA